MEIISAATVDRIVALITVERVIAGPFDQAVVPFATVNEVMTRVRLDRVMASKSVDTSEVDPLINR